MFSFNLVIICPKLLVLLNVFFSFLFSSGKLETTSKKGLFMYKVIRCKMSHVLETGYACLTLWCDSISASLFCLYTFIELEDSKVIIKPRGSLGIYPVPSADRSEGTFTSYYFYYVIIRIKNNGGNLTFVTYF